MLKTVILIVSIAVTAQATSYLKDKPTFFNSCYLEDKNFNSCFGGNFQLMLREWHDGVPGLKSAGKFDPLHVKRVKLSHDSGGSVSLHSELINVDIVGASKLIVQAARLDRQPWISHFKVFFPKLRFDSDYKLRGRLLSLPLNGEGKSFFEAENVTVVIKINMVLRDEHDLTFTDIETLSVDIQNVDNFRMNLDNLFNGQKTLEDSVNALFNENWRDFYDVLRPVVQQTMEKILSDRFKKIFAYVPANYIIADFPRAADFKN